MEQWTAEHRAFVVEAYFKSGDSVVAVQRQFRRRFNVGPRGKVPTRNTILLWVDNFRATSLALKRKSTGRPRSARTPENVERVREAVEASPRRPARKQAIKRKVFDNFSARLEECMAQDGHHLKDVIFKS
ncbi:hypothetical protein ACJJTC_014783 [Scirpophaga incertulas]